jgi:hypothetical protein
MSKAYGAIAVIEGDANDDNSDLNGGFQSYRRMKQGASFCGGCCDMRRAVIVVNAVMIAMIVCNCTVLFLVSNGEVEVDDDVVTTKLHNIPKGPFLLVFVLQMTVYAIGIWGAVSFSLWQLYLVSFLYSLTFVLNLLAFNLPAVFFAGGFAFPHFILIREIKAGIMTRANYYNEEQSCCCVVE